MLELLEVGGSYWQSAKSYGQVISLLGRSYTILELVSRHFCKDVPTGRVTVGMASLYLESLRGVQAQ